MESPNYIQDLYDKRDNIQSSLDRCEKFFMLHIKRMIGVHNEFTLPTPISVVTPDGVIEVQKVSYACEDCLWLSYPNPKAIPSGYSSIQSWKIDRVDGNRKVWYLSEICRQIDEVMGVSA